jgi:hypothetical protein
MLNAQVRGKHWQTQCNLLACDLWSESCLLHCYYCLCTPALLSCKVIGDGLEVKPSTIPGAGNGLFCTVPFRKNEYVTQYSGLEISGTALESALREERAALKRGRDPHSHTLSINCHKAIVGLSAIPATSGQGGGSYANDARERGRNNTEYQRLQLSGATELIVLRATRDITEGEEILVHYGDDYWKKRGL